MTTELKKMKEEKGAMIPVTANTWTAVRNLTEAIQLAQIVAKSLAIPDVRNEGQALVKILCGAEMGFGPFASLVDVHIIEGKPAIGAKLMAAAIKRSGVYDYAVKRLDSETCEIDFLCRGKVVGSVDYTMTEADKAGVSLGKGGGRKANWQRHPDDMLFARCISKGFRRYCPDLCGGVVAYDPDELDNPIGPVVEAEYTVIPKQVEPCEEKEPDPTIPEEMVVRFAELTTSLGLSAALVIERLKKTYGKDSFRKLTEREAQEVLDKLERALDAKQQTTVVPAVAS